MSLDLNTLAKKDTTELHLRHPVTDAPLYDDKDKAVVISLYGTSSKQYKQQVLNMNNARLKRGKQKPTAELLESEGIELLVACSIEAKNLTLDGEKINTPELFRKLYKDERFDWLRDQVDTALGDTANFLDQ